MTLTLIVIGALGMGIALGRIWDAFRARHNQEQREWDLQEIKTRINTRVAAIGKKPEEKVAVEKKVA